jgi:hypothetical protein
MSVVVCALAMKKPRASSVSGVSLSLSFFVLGIFRRRLRWIFAKLRTKNIGLKTSQDWQKSPHFFVFAGINPAFAHFEVSIHPKI